jgi:hypothetical protein
MSRRKLEKIFLVAHSAEEARLLLWRSMVNATAYGYSSREAAEAALTNRRIPEKFRKGLGIAEFERGREFVDFTPPPPPLPDSPFVTTGEWKGFPVKKYPRRKMYPG